MSEGLLITKQVFGKERALYMLQNASVSECRFEGEEDGESALKEARDISVKKCCFSLRYPLWHVKHLGIYETTLSDSCRAPLWYSSDIHAEHNVFLGVKTMRECSRAILSDCEIDSSEFGWKCADITLSASRVKSEYAFLDSRNISLSQVRFEGKYSFQYVNNTSVSDCLLKTKDAFWHAKNATVRDSVLSGEYLGWYSDGLTLINCRISGTQPLCYCKNLQLINCTMEGCDLSFEYSEVTADIRGHIRSIKNPASGMITVDAVDEVIMDETVIPRTGTVIVRK